MIPFIKQEEYFNYYIFFGFNFIFNKFTIINDTKKLFFPLYNNEEKKAWGTQIKKLTKIVKKLRYDIINNDSSISIIRFNNDSSLEKNRKILGSKKRFSLTNNFQESSFFQRNVDNKNLNILPFASNKDIRNIYNHNEKKIINNDSEVIEVNKVEINENEKQNKKKSKSIKVLNIPKNLSNKNNFDYSIPNHNIVDKDILDFKVLLNKYFDYKKNNFIYEKMNIKNIERILTMRNFLISLFCYKKSNNYVLILKKFRRKLLSEEHFFRSQNYLYLFEKYFDLRESKKIDIIELYKNL